MKSGDKIEVDKIIEKYENRLIVKGSVYKPGVYSLSKNMTVKDLILEAGGVSEDVYRYKIEIARNDPNSLNDKTFAEMTMIEKNEISHRGKAINNLIFISSLYKKFYLLSNSN